MSHREGAPVYQTRERPMGDMDLPQLEQLELACFPVDPWSAETFASLLGSPAVRGIVLEGEEGIEGYLLVYEVLDEAEVLNIAIRPDRRGQGLGRKLLGSWLAQVRKDGVRRVYLDVRESNLPAIGLYRSFGFRGAGKRSRYYSDGEHALEMVLDLNDAPTGGRSEEQDE